MAWPFTVAVVSSLIYLTVGFIFGLQTVDGVATQLGQFQYVFGDWREFVKGANRYLAVTAKDVQRVAAKYLVDTTGHVRHIKFGEGDYNVTEQLIRQLVMSAHPGLTLPPLIDTNSSTENERTTPETYFGVGKVVNYGGGGLYDEGTTTFDYPPTLGADSFALRGRWSLDYQGATANSDQSSIKLNYHAANVYLVIGGAGNVTVTREGRSFTVPVSGPPTSHQIVFGEHPQSGTLEVRPDQGLQVFSFTYG